MKGAIDPLFSDVTWGAGGSTAELTLDIATYLRETGHVSNMHMTCTNMEKDGDPKIAVHSALETAHKNGIRNIVALRGDPAAGQEEWVAAEGGFTCALDLVLYMREHFGDEFGISVAGYPEGHPNAISEIDDPSSMSDAEKGRSSFLDGKTFTCKDVDYEKEMEYLKKKIDAGAGESLFRRFASKCISAMERLPHSRLVCRSNIIYCEWKTLSLPKCSLTPKCLERLWKTAVVGALHVQLFLV